MTRHLAIFSSKDYIEAILKREKTIEGRLTKDKIAPFGVIKHGDIIMLKLRGGMVFGQVEVDNVLFYENLTGEIIGKLRKEYSGEMLVDNEFWTQHANARYATVIFLDKPKRFLTPLKVAKKDRRPWVVYND